MVSASSANFAPCLTVCLQDGRSSAMLSHELLSMLHRFMSLLQTSLKRSLGRPACHEPSTSSPYTKNTLNQQSKTPNVTTSKQTTSASTHSDPKRKTYDYSNQNSQAYKNSSSERNIPMNSAKQAGNYQHANVTSKRQSNGTRIFWNSNIDSLNLKQSPQNKLIPVTLTLRGTQKMAQTIILTIHQEQKRMIRITQNLSIILYI